MKACGLISRQKVAPEMGCDIHLHIETRRKKRANDELIWFPFGGEFRLWRNYDLFGRLAGVRSATPALVKARGIPDDLAYTAAGTYWIHVGDDDSWEGGNRSVSLDRAQQWGTATKRDKDGNIKYVADPDCHTPTWLTPEEFREALGDTPAEWIADYHAVLAAAGMLSFLGHDVRLVIWFDN